MIHVAGGMGGGRYLWNQSRCAKAAQCRSYQKKVVCGYKYKQAQCKYIRELIVIIIFPVPLFLTILILICLCSVLYMYSIVTKETTIIELSTHQSLIDPVFSSSIGFFFRVSYYGVHTTPRRVTHQERIDRVSLPQLRGRYLLVFGQTLLHYDVLNIFMESCSSSRSLGLIICFASILSANY